MKTLRFESRKMVRILAFLMVAFIGVLQYAPVCHASNETVDSAGAETAEEVAKKVTQPLNAIIIVILVIMAAIGALILVKNVGELAHAIQDRDTSGMWQAGRGIGAGLLLISIRLIMSLFGYNF